ncbi:MAG: hypothetical protein M3Z05_10900 [Gemmatimonadota bacterium]|nr:hypothetical protein [Gemmatimonadota bacterium]
MSSEQFGGWALAVLAGENITTVVNRETTVVEIMLHRFMKILSGQEFRWPVAKYTVWFVGVRQRRRGLHPADNPGERTV